MFERKQYKSFARTQLKGRWSVPVVMTLIVVIISSIFQIPDMVRTLSSDAFWNLVNSSSTDFNQIMFEYTQITNSTSSNVSAIIQVIVTAIMEVATINLYLQMARSPEKVTLKSFIEGFNNWARALLAALWQTLWVFLWMLLFIIPGIVKAIAYSQMFYLITEYKNLSVTKAMRISMLITKGHKWDLFVLDLSFLGWALLCCLTLGIGALWLEPYMKMTSINAYHAMLKEALESGVLKPEDLTE